MNNINISKFFEWNDLEIKKEREKVFASFKLSLSSKDTLICTELINIGNSLHEILDFLVFLNSNSIKLISLKNMDINFSNNDKLIKLLYESEKKIVSAKMKKIFLKAKGSKKIGRPKGSKSKFRILDEYNQEILELLNLNISQTNILKIVNSKLKKKITITTLRYHIDNTEYLKKAKDNFGKGSLLK